MRRCKGASNRLRRKRQIDDAGFAPPAFPAADRFGRRAIAGHGLRAEADLLHEGDEVVEEILLDDLPVVAPASDRAELHVERLAGRLDLRAVGLAKRAGERAAKARDGAGPVATREEDAVGSVVEMLVREGAEEIERFALVILDAVRRRLAGPGPELPAGVEPGSAVRMRASRR